MEERKRHTVRELTIEDSFECSRLERRLLAQAYEQIIPPITRSARQSVSGEQLLRCSSNQLHRSATGG